MCVGAEAEDCHLSGYIHIYINGRTGGIPILERTSIKSPYIILETWFYKSYMSFEHNIFRALRLY